jgi:hypothetical protein
VTSNPNDLVIVIGKLYVIELWLLAFGSFNFTSILFSWRLC